MTVDKMILSIRNFPDKKCGTGAVEAEIADAERSLGVRFPESYRVFLKTFGWGRFGHEEFYGLGTDIPEDLKHLDLVKVTLSERLQFEPHMPPHLIPVRADGAGNHFCLDTAKLSNNEAPVVFWDHDEDEDQDPDVVSSSFDRWLVEILQELLPA